MATFTVEPPKFKVVEPKKSGFTVEPPFDEDRDVLSRALGKAEGIENPPTLSERLVTQLKRKGIGLPAFAMLGDVPFARQTEITDQPKGKISDFVPASGIEKAGVAIPRFIRDVAITSKIAPLKGVRFLAAAAGFGALTADTEDPKEIATKAAATAAGFKVVDAGLRYIPKAASFAYEKLPGGVKTRLAKFGESLAIKTNNFLKLENLRFKRHADIQVAQIEGEQFAREMEATLTKPEREALPFLIEKTGIPKILNRPDIIEAVRNPEKRKVMLAMSERLGKIYDNFHVKLKEIYGDDVGFIQDYINRLWDIPKNKQQIVTNWFMTKPPNIKERLISTIQEGVNKFGLKPKTLDAAQLFRFYNNSVTTAIANMRLLKGIKSLKSSSGEALILPSHKAPESWIRIDHPVLRRGIGIPTSESGKTLIAKVPAAVHPEIAEEMKAIFGQKINNASMRTIEGINAFAKHSQLGLSLFHHVALAESAIASGIMNPRNMLKVIKDMKHGKRPIVDDPLSREWVQAGLQVGAPMEVGRNLVESYLLAAEDGLKKGFIGKLPSFGVKAARKAVEFNNRFLWDYYHPNLKLFAANKLYQDALKMPQFAHLPPQVVKREVAQFVNDSFGGQAWDLMVRSQGWQQMMNLILLSPDWTISTLRQALSVFGVGARNEIAKGLRAELGQNFWKAGALTMFSGINNLNRMFTKFYLGQPRNMWENDPGKETNLFLGFNPDGSKRYLRWGKQFRELPEFFIKDGYFQPLGATTKKIEGKLAPLNQLIKEQFRPFPYGKLGKAVGTKDETKERLATIAQTFLPFSLREQPKGRGFTPLQFAFPISGTKGAAYYNFQTQFKEALRDGNKDRIRRIYKAAVENGINAKALLKRAAGDIEYEDLRVKENSQEVFQKLISMPEDSRKNYLQSLNLPEKTLKRVRRLYREWLISQKEAERIRNNDGLDEKTFNKLLQQLIKN